MEEEEYMQHMYNFVAQYTTAILCIVLQTAHTILHERGYTPPLQTDEAVVVNANDDDDELFNFLALNCSASFLSEIIDIIISILWRRRRRRRMMRRLMIRRLNMFQRKRRGI
jgi:hypothetical protein